MSKPLTIPTWATDDAYPASAAAWSETPTKVAPTALKAAQGWAPNEKPPAPNLNSWQNLVGQWAAYLDAGALEGDHSIDGALAVTGDATLGGAVSVVGAVGAGGNVTAPDLRHTTPRSRHIHAAAAIPNTAGPTFASGAWTVGTTVADLFYPVTLDVGDVITGWLIWLTKGSAAGTVSADLWETNHSTGVTTKIGATASNSAANPGTIALVDGGMAPHTVAGDCFYFLTIRGGGTAGDTFRGAEVNYTRP